ncbi:MAG: hypothetical protein JSW71_15225, partial [Gemmatimonadota bacterium]
PAVVFATLLGTAFGVKLLIWGKGPIRRPRGTPHQTELERRVVELEERCEQWSELTSQQADLIAEIEERLDFAERLLTRQRAEQPRGLEPPES